MITFLEQKIDLLEASIRTINKLHSSWRHVTCINNIHLSRTISRRAETHVVALSKNEEINKDAAIYLNRLSDLMFVLARSINNRKKIPDIVWKP